MELDDYRIKPIFITKHRMSRGLGGTNAVQYFADWDEVSVKTWNTKPIWNKTEILYLDIGLEIRYKSEKRMQNIESIRCNLPNVLSRVLMVKEILQAVIECVVIPEGGLENMIAKLLDQTYILKELVHVGS